MPTEQRPPAMTAPTPQPQKTEPYLSDDGLLKVVEKAYGEWLDDYSTEFVCAKAVRDHYEPELTRLRTENEALRSAGQKAADALADHGVEEIDGYLFQVYDEPSVIVAINALSEVGIKPTT